MKEEKESPFILKFNWGTGITAAILIFIAATLSVVGYVTSLDFHLVSENHYEEAVNYQEHIDRQEHARNMPEPVVIELKPENQTIQILFPGQLNRDGLEGTVSLYRPGNSSLDKNIILNPGRNGVQQISTRSMERGKWLVRISWSLSGTNYYQQEEIFL